MKYLIVGLGNIGDEYAETRHNVGFQVVDELARSADGTWKNVTLGSICEIKHKSRTLILLKPNTYMNLSGKSVAYWMQKEKITLENILVIVDEIQLDLGVVRLRGKGSDGGHNGLRDIQAVLNTTDYARLRIGVGKNFHEGGQVRYVLGKWNNEERKLLPEIYRTAVQAIQSFVTIGLKRTMDSVNAVTIKPKPSPDK